VQKSLKFCNTWKVSYPRLLSGDLQPSMHVRMETTEIIHDPDPFENRPALGTSREIDVLITSDTSGIGLAAARQFIKEDSRLSRPGAADSRTGLASKDPGSASLPGRRDRRQAGLETCAT